MSFYFSKVTMFCCPTFQMENLKPSRLNALNVLLNCATAGAELGREPEESFAKELGAALGN